MLISNSICAYPFGADVRIRRFFMYEVALVGCDEYEFEKVKAALLEAIGAIGGLDGIVEAGTKVAIKANLVAAASPESATTTHPVFLCALCEILKDRGAEVVIGDSPGGLYNAAFVGRIYKAAGLHDCEKYGAVLNGDFSESHAVFEEAKVLKTFDYTSYLDNADVIINACKLKTHGMMGLSCAAKNMFGTVPGTKKPEYHFRYPSYEAFADMIIDLDEYFKPVLSVCDAIVGMEGNGPTAGTARHIGCVLASYSPHKLDTVAASVIGLPSDNVPTLIAAAARGLTPSSADEISVYGDVEKYVISDYQNIGVKRSLLFKGDSKNVIKSIFGSIAKSALNSRPKLHKKSCVGCNLCGNICPAKAITIVKGKAVIDTSKCIRCFCCQEFCPKGAMRVKRTLIATLLQREKKKKDK